MSTIVKNIINSALKQDVKALVLNIKNEKEIEDFDFDIYTLDQTQCRAIKIKQEQIPLLDITCIINLRPYENNIREIVGLGQNLRIPIFNYIVELSEKKPEILIAKSRILQEFNINVFKNSDDAEKVYLPNKQILNEKEFSEILK